MGSVAGYRHRDDGNAVHHGDGTWVTVEAKMKKIPKVEYKLYILMRNDLPSLNPGKAMAQAAHAANAFTVEWGHYDSVKEYSNKKHPFGTCIVLAAYKDTIIQKLKRAQMRDIPPPFGPVYDPTFAPLSVRQPNYDCEETIT